MANCPRSQGGGALYNTFFSERPPLSPPLPSPELACRYFARQLSTLAQTAGNSSKFKDPAGTWSPSAPPSRQGCASARSVSACAHFLISLVLVAAEQLQSMLSSYGRHSLPPAFQPDRNSFQVCLYIFSLYFFISLNICSTYFSRSPPRPRPRPVSAHTPSPPSSPATSPRPRSQQPPSSPGL